MTEKQTTITGKTTHHEHNYTKRKVRRRLKQSCRNADYMRSIKC